MENRPFPDELPDCAKPGPIPGLIPIDSLFSPVRRVKYDVVNTRVGRRTDCDKLTLEIWTDGRISPDEALTLSAAILRHHPDVFVNKQKLVEMGLSLGMTFDPEVLSLIKPAD